MTSSTSGAQSSVQTWALITGEVRNPIELLAVFQDILRARDLGHIEGVVWSTWVDQRVRAPAVFEAIERSGVAVIESLRPKFPEVSGTPQSAWSQIFAMQVGLQLVPSKAYVLKARTDYFPEKVRYLLKAAFNIGMPWPNDFVQPQQMFQDKITTAHLNTIPLYDFFDLHFFCPREMLVNTLSLGLVMEATCPDASMWPAESRIWGERRIISSSVLSLLTSSFDPERMYSTMCNTFSRNQQVPSLIARLYANYFVDLLTDFQLLSTGNEPSVLPLRFAELFIAPGRLCSSPMRSLGGKIEFDHFLRVLPRLSPDDSDGNAKHFLHLINQGLDDRSSIDFLAALEVEEIIEFDQNLPPAERFLLRSGQTISQLASLASPAKRREVFNVAGLLSANGLLSLQSTKAFNRYMDLSYSIEDAAWAVVQDNLLFDNGAPEEANSERLRWLNLAALFGNLAAMERLQDLDLKTLSHHELRVRRADWVAKELNGLN